MADIFISYARADCDFARRLSAYLEDAGLTVWWDMSLQPGQVFGDEIERRIGEARHVIVIWSATSVKSDFVQDEADVARKQNKLVPIRIDGCEPPIGFRRYHTHTVSAWPGDLAPLLAAVGGGKAPAKTAAAPAKTAQDFLDSAKAAYDSGDYDRAISYCSEALRLEPDCAEAYSNRGLVYSGKCDYGRAIADFDQAVGLKPDYADAYYNRGNAYSDKGDHGRAIADFDQAIRLKPDDADSYFNRGNAYRAKGDNGRAIADYDQVIRSNPDDASAYNNRGNAWYDEGDYARAICDFDRALQINPDVANAIVGKALAEMALAKARK
jgi:tetratricopeptide (TPR) repeat protein